MKKEQYVVFSMVMQQYAFSLDDVIEILRMPHITHVPGSSPIIEGVMNLRGVIIPVVNLHARFQFQKLPTSKKSRVIIVQYEQQNIGIIVDEIDRVTAIQRVSDEDLTYSHIEEDIFVGFGKAAGQIVGILDVKKVL